MLTEKTEIPVENTSNELLMWRDKYERLLHHYNALQKVNQQLEDKLLTIVEKSEHDKLLLSTEIDHLAERLANSTNTADYLRHECGRYKSDCMLAVHLLQCQPTVYGQQKINMLPEELQRKISPLIEPGGSLTPKPNEKKLLTMSTQMTFPPTAVFLHNAAEEEAPPEPVSSPGVRSKIPEIFVKNILDQPDYQTPKLMQCPKCGQSVAKFDRQTQTSIMDFANLIEFNDHDHDDDSGSYRAGVHVNSRRTLSGGSHTSTETPV